MSEAAERQEVWLRGNVRPVAGLVALVVIAAAAAAAALAAAGLPRLAGTVVAAAGVALAAAVVVGRAAAAPRLARVGDRLEVRLAPGRVERVPLEVVECVFRGSEALGEERDPEVGGRFRVGTLVIRFAERAAAWKSRPAFRLWGTWNDGHVVIDGRWCEPLSRDKVQAIAAALLEAKRTTGGAAAC